MRTHRPPAFDEILPELLGAAPEPAHGADAGDGSSQAVIPDGGFQKT
jgi:hypothetical protein